jgi:hypothetical protein
MDLPEPQRRQKVNELISEHEARAQARMFETKFMLDNSPETNVMIEDLAIMFGRSNFWTSLDVRDAAQAAEKGLLADYESSHEVYVTDDQNAVGLPTQELAEVWFPEVTNWKRPLSGTETLVSINRVRELIGFEVKYHYR